MNVVVTGAAGFVGHHLIEHLIKNTDWHITVIDKLSYSAPGWDRLRDIDVFCSERVTCIEHNITSMFECGLMKEIGDVNLILHLAASSHVDRSIHHPREFIDDNIIGTFHMLEFALNMECRMIYFSTDEVYGVAPGKTMYVEGDRCNPGNPYSASKAAAENLCYAWANTFGVNVQITNTMNIFGERQHPEKYIPLVMRKLLDDEELLIHSSADLKTPGSRFWLHARNVADALLFIITNATETLDSVDASIGRYHIVGREEIDNLTMARKIAQIMDKDLRYKLVDFHSSRPGHDLRYGLSGEKMSSIGWEPAVDMDESLERTIRWTMDHNEWLGI